jgi:hypothetical protein
MLTACAASGVHVSEAQISNFQKGVTRYEDVVLELGNPTSKTLDSAQNTQIIYVYSEYQTRPETFIPYVGAFVGGADTRTNIASFKFNEAGLLQDYSFSETALGTASNLSAGVQPGRVAVKARSKE